MTALRVAIVGRLQRRMLIAPLAKDSMAQRRWLLVSILVVFATIASGEHKLLAGGPQHFDNQPPGASLPDGLQCAAWVKSSPSAPEVRPENTPANMTNPKPDELATFHARPLF